MKPADIRWVFLSRMLANVAPADIEDRKRRLIDDIVAGRRRVRHALSEGEHGEIVDWRYVDGIPRDFLLYGHVDWTWSTVTFNGVTLANIEVAEVPGRRAKGRPSRARALAALRDIYGDDVPDQASEPDYRLCCKVAERLKANGLPGVSNDTILRAAGRRK